MKRTVCFLLAIGICCLLTACASQKNQSLPKVLIVLKTEPGSFTEDFTGGAKEAAKKYGLDLTFNTVLTEDAAQKQADLIRSAAQEGYKGLILDPVDSDIVAQAVGEAKKSRLAVVTVNNKSQIGQNYTVDIDENQMASGVFSLAQRLTGKDSSVLVLNCLDDSDNTQRLADVLRTGINEFPDMKWHEIDFHIGENIKLQDSFNQYLASDRNNNCIIALNDYATFFSSNLLTTLTDGRKTGLISFSRNKNTISLLEQNRVDAICVNRNINLGFSAAEEADLAIGGKTAQNVLIPSVFVNMQNLYSSDIQEILFPLQ